MYLRKNKKAVSEITSFILITLLIVVAGTSAYLYSLNSINENVEQLDRRNMEVYLKKMNYKINEILAYDSSTISQEFFFNKGQFGIEDSNRLYYKSMILTESSLNSCFQSLCYVEDGGVEKVYLDLPTGYTFSTNISLDPANYKIVFIHEKDDSKITVKFY